METTIVILAIIAGIAGIAGSILPGLPGTPVSWVGLLLLYIWGPVEMPLRTLMIWGVVMVVVSVVDYVVPMYFTKLTGGSKHAERGALIGLIAGIFMTPIGMILGSFLGFMIGTGIKTIASVLIMWKILVFAF